MTEKKIILIILDGWGHGKKDEGDCVYNAKTPFIDSLYDCQKLNSSDSMNGVLSSHDSTKSKMLLLFSYFSANSDSDFDR